MSVKRIVAVVGCQRSGTTLTGQILGAHASAVLLDEPDGVYKWFRAEAAGHPSAPEKYQDVLVSAANKYRDFESRFILRKSGIMLRARVTTLILKAPNLTYDYAKLQALPTPVTVVYPVRDPRSVVSSMMRLEGKDFAGNQLRLIGKRDGTVDAFLPEQEMLASDKEPLWVRCAAVWKIKTGLAPAFRQAGLPVFQFRYEDLVQKQGVVAEMLEHCGLAATSETLNPETAYTGKGPGGTDRTRPVDTDSLSIWKDYLDESQTADVMRVSSPLAGTLGYS
jgi:hypothetical protein